MKKHGKDTTKKHGKNMTKNDYDLMMHICNYALRKGHDLDIGQISDINNLMIKIHKQRTKKDKKYALVRSKKMGKTTGI